jgi:hypothetical protein
MFATAADLSCDSIRITPVCIPFRYARDGCWARAHEMYRILSPTAAIGKCWLYGNLKVRTANDPTCEVNWRYHVAPIVTVKDGAGNKPIVLDPALFTRPVSPSEWAAKQILNGTPVLTDGRVYYRSTDGKVSYDDGFGDTAVQLRPCSSTHIATLSFR